LDFLTHNTRYIAVPRYLMGGIEVARASAVELQELSRLLGEPVQVENVRVLVCEGRRFPIVAAAFLTGETDFEFPDDPFKRIDANRDPPAMRPWQPHELPA
jgi:hypothetical protein